MITRFLCAFLWATIVIVLIGVLTAVAGLAVARWSLPASACAVNEAAIATLELEKMKEPEVVSRLGCDGVHTVELDSEQLRIETVSWRLDDWPYGVFEAYLINGVLHGTKQLRLTLKVSLPPRADST
jgi:hypothetical protein